MLLTLILGKTIKVNLHEFELHFLKIALITEQEQLLSLNVYLFFRDNRVELIFDVLHLIVL